MARDRQQTCVKLLDAAVALLQAEGLGGLGVNALAARAGVDKVLIYRYFGGIDGILDELVEHTTLWPSADALLPQGGSVSDLLQAYLSTLQAHPLALALLRATPSLQDHRISKALHTNRSETDRCLAGRFDLTHRDRLDLQASLPLFLDGLLAKSESDQRKALPLAASLLQARFPEMRDMASLSDAAEDDSQTELPTELL